MTTTEDGITKREVTRPPDGATPPPTKKQVQKAQQTDYTVLLRGPTGWQELTEAVASSAEAAVRIGAEGKEGTYVAIPLRSWKPVKVSVETVSRVHLENAS